MESITLNDYRLSYLNHQITESEFLSHLVDENEKTRSEITKLKKDIEELAKAIDSLYYRIPQTEEKPNIII